MDIVMPPFGHLPSGVHGAFAGRMGGVSRAPYLSLNVAHGIGDRVPAVRENRQRLLQALDLDRPLVAVRQVHGIEIAWIESVSARRPPTADAVGTRRPDLALLMASADCPLIVLAPENAALVVAYHAGWRGEAAGITESVVAFLRDHHLVAPRNLRAWIAPSVGPCCFEVGEEVVDAFRSRALAHVNRGRGPRPYLDLPGIVEATLISSGLLPAHVVGSGLCTVCHRDRFFSYRADGGQTGRNGLVVWLDRNRSGTL